MASYAWAGESNINNAHYKASGKSLSSYMRDKHAWEQANPNRTKEYDGSVRKALGQAPPPIADSLVSEGYDWVRTGTGKTYDGTKGMASQKGEGYAKPIDAPEWTLVQRSSSAAPQKQQDSGNSKQDTPQTTARFEPSPELTNTATAIDALERAEEYQKQADAAKDAANPSPFRKSGDGLYASISDIGTRALDYYDRFTKPLAEQRAMLGIQEVGESLGYNASRLRSDIKLPETMGIDDTLEYVKRFQGLIG